LDFALEDALPVVDIEFDYYTIFSGDSVKFDFTVNQDVLMDSILIARPADSAGTIITDVFDYDDILFQAKDQFGANIIYYLPPHGSASEYFPRIRGAFYYFRIVGKKAYGAQVEFRILYQIGL
jgi:hypothetical protein